MINLRLKQVQCALTDGLLDEAYRLAQDRTVREHRDGQRLRAKIADALTRRATHHLQADRLDDADADCQRAAQLAGSTPHIAELRARLDQALQERSQSRQTHAHRNRLARQALRAGRHSQGLQLLNDTSTHTPSTRALAMEIDMHRRSTQQAAALAADALKRGELEQAVAHLASIPQDTHAQDIIELRRKLIEQSIQQIHEDINAARLPRAFALYDTLGKLNANRAGLNELTYHLNDCRDAWRLAEAGRYREAAHRLHRIAPHYPKARWINDTITQLTDAAEHTERVHQSPLGQLCYIMDHPAAQEPGIGRTALSASEWRDNQPDRVAQPINMQPPVSPQPVENTLLRIDGIGSYLLAPGPVTTIGPISSKHRPQVGLVADPTLPVFSIERCDDDFIAACPQPLRVNDTAATQHLLRHNDKLALTPRCRLKFTRPNAASTTAVVQLAGSRLPQGDVRNIVLMGRELVIANHAGAHVRSGAVKSPITLVASNGALTCRTDAACVDGPPIPAGEPLPFEQTIEIDNLRFTLSRS